MLLKVYLKGKMSGTVTGAEEKFVGRMAAESE
jgi:hypothetical protein